MSLEERINQVRHTLGTVEALLVQAEENLKGCQQTQQTRLEMAKAQIEYRLVKNNIETLENMSKTHEMTVKQQENTIKTLEKRLNTLQEDIAALVRQKVNLHRGLRALGGMWGNRRQIGLPRQRGRIIGVPGAAECESGCGQTDTSILMGTASDQARTICYNEYNPNVPIRACVLNLAAAASVVIMAAAVSSVNSVSLAIQRPAGIDVTDQRAQVWFGKNISCGLGGPILNEVEACEVLPAGNYTWILVYTGGVTVYIYAAWMKAREITCA